MKMKINQEHNQVKKKPEPSVVSTIQDDDGDRAIEFEFLLYCIVKVLNLVVFIK